jgi:DNA-binding transcriptional LysR family regulator
LRRLPILSNAFERQYQYRIGIDIPFPKPMDIRQISYFTAVAEELNFTRAAKRLHITQPPLTRQIQSLEDSLGVGLFVRSPQGLQLTEAGKALLADARHLTSLMAQTVERAQMAGRGEAGRLDVGYFGTSVLDLLPRLLAAYRLEHPQVKVVLHPGQTPAQVQALRQGRVSVVFERRLPREPDIAVELVTREDVFIALPEGHRLAAHKVVDVKDLRDIPMVLPEGLPAQVDAMAMKLCRAHGFEPKESQRCLDMMSGTALVAGGCGVFLVPASMTVVGMPGVTYRPLKSRIPAQFDLYCFYLKDRPSKLVEGLLEVVRQAFNRINQPVGSRKSNSP